MPETLHLSHLEQTIYFAALRHGTAVLDADLVRRLANVSRPHANKLLAEMARKGVLHRVGRGRYVVIASDVVYDRRAYVADPFQVIGELMQKAKVSEYYVAYQSAALVYGAANQLPQSLLVAVPKQRRLIDLGASQVLFVQLRPVKFFGCVEARYHDAYFNCSDPAKTVLDCLDRPDLCGGVEEVAAAIGRLLPMTNTDLLLSYLPRMQSKSLAQRLGMILEQLGSSNPAASELLDEVASHVGGKTIPLDLHGPVTGLVHPRWRVRANVDLVFEA